MIGPAESGKVPRPSGMGTYSLALDDDATCSPTCTPTPGTYSPCTPVRYHVASDVDGFASSPWEWTAGGTGPDDDDPMAWVYGDGTMADEPDDDGYLDALGAAHRTVDQLRDALAAAHAEVMVLRRKMAELAD